MDGGNAQLFQNCALEDGTPCRRATALHPWVPTGHLGHLAPISNSMANRLPADQSPPTSISSSIYRCKPLEEAFLVEAQFQIFF